jgi:dGTPase
VLHGKLNSHIKGEAERTDKNGSAILDEDAKETALQGGGFGANPQNLRIVALLEAKFAGGGLDLTRATLDGLVKYTDLYDYKKHDKSKCVYRSDKDLFDWIKDGIKDKCRQPIEGQIADWADQMAYSINDMEDVVRAGLLSFPDLRSRKDEVSQMAIEDFRKSREKRGEGVNAEPPALLLPSAIEELAKELEGLFLSPSSLMERKVNLKQWTSKTVKDLKQDCRIEDLKNDETSIRYKVRLVVPALAEARSVLLKTIAGILVFSDPRVKTLEAKGKFVIEALFDKFCENIELLPLDFQEMISSKKFGSKERLVSDFIAGMTDKYAYSYYGRLTLPGIGSFYEFV